MRRFMVEMNPDRQVTLEAILFDPPSPDEQPSSLEHPRPALIVCPGGGYAFLSQREGDPVAVAFQRHGFNVFILRYSIGQHAASPNPSVDAARAVRWVRLHAADLGVDPDRIALMGFSAGGHVTASLGTRWHREELVEAERAEYAELEARAVEANTGLMAVSSRPDAIVPAYAVFDFDWCPPEERARFRVVEDCSADVTDHVPPSFVWTTAEDEVVPAAQSLKFVSALIAAGVDVEYHHFQRGVHGLSTADALANADRASLPENAGAWVDLCARWLRATWADK